MRAHSMLQDCMQMAFEDISNSQRRTTANDFRLRNAQTRSVSTNEITNYVLAFFQKWKQYLFI